MDDTRNLAGRPRLASAFELAWFFLLVLTPFHLRLPFEATGISGIGAAACAGLALGIGLARTPPATRLFQASAPLRTGMAGAGFFLAAIFALPEWIHVLAPEANRDAISSLAGVIIRPYSAIQVICLFASGLLLAYTCVAQAQDGLATSGLMRGRSAATALPEAFGRSKAVRFIIAPFLFTYIAHAVQPLFFASPLGRLIALAAAATAGLYALLLRRATPEPQTEAPNREVLYVLSSCMGVWIWALFTRATGRFDLASVLLGVAGAGVIAAVVVFSIPRSTETTSQAGTHAPTAGNGSITDDSAHDSASEQKTDELLRELGLSPREREVALLTLSGARSKDVGERLGIKPASVRATMHRVYGKLELSGIDELQELITETGGSEHQAASATDSTTIEATREPCDATGTMTLPFPKRLRVAVNIQLASSYLLSILLFTPRELKLGAWHTGRATVLGVTCGLLILAAQHGIAVASEQAGMLRRTTRTVPAPLWILGSTLLLMAGAWANALSTETLRVPSAFESSLQFALAAINTTLLLTANTNDRAHTASYLGSSATRTLILAACTAPLALYMVPYLDLALVLSASLAFAISSWITQKADSGSACCQITATNRETGEMPRTAMLFGITSFVMGLFWEELWGSLGGLNGVSETAFFAPFLVGLFIVSLPRERKDTITFLTAIAATLFLGVVGGMLASVAIALALVTFTSLSIRASRCLLPSQTILVIACLCSAVGVASGHALLGASRVALEHVAQQSFYTAGTLIPSLHAIALAAVSTIAGIALWLLQRELSFDAAPLPTALGHRARAYLISQGASETQAAVLAEIATGASVREVAERLHYAPGTVKSARRAGYALLGIHDRQGLKQLLLSQLDNV